MNIAWRKVTRGQAVRSFYSELKNRVFHITSITNVSKIIQSGEVRHNLTGELKSNGTYNAFFKNRGCVSFCDLYNNRKPRKVREAALTKYNIFSQGDGQRFAYFFLKPESYEKLILWSEWKNQEAWSEMVVPYLESGYPGYVPLSEIEEISLIHIPLGVNEKKIEEILKVMIKSKKAKANS